MSTVNDDALALGDPSGSEAEELLYVTTRRPAPFHSQADWGAFSSSRQGDLTIVRIGAEVRTMEGCRCSIAIGAPGPSTLSVGKLGPARLE